METAKAVQEAPGAAASPPLEQDQITFWEHAKRIGAHAARIGVAVGALAAASLYSSEPSATEHAITTTVVETDFATSPLELRPTTNGWNNLDLGVLGSYYTQNTSQYGLSARATDLPRYGSGQITDLLSPGYLKVINGVVTDPDETIVGYSELLRTEVRQNGQEALARRTLITFGGGVIIGGALLVAAGSERRRKLIEHPNVSAAAIVSISAVLGMGIHIAEEVSTQNSIALWQSHSPAPQVEKLYPINLPKGMDDREVYAINSTLQIGTNQAMPLWNKTVTRTKQQYAEHDFTSTAALEQNFYKVEGPRQGEYVTIDIADPQLMKEGVQRTKQFIDLYVDKYGANKIRAITIAGDLVQLGSPGENAYLDELLTLGQDPDDKSQIIPVVVVGGDHDSPETIAYAQENGLVVPDLETANLSGFNVIGANDRAQKLLGIPTTFRDGVTEEQLGDMLREAMSQQPVNQAILHQPYALAGLLGIKEMNRQQILDFVSDSSNLTTFTEDFIPNLAAANVTLGHFHGAYGPRVIWNVDPITKAVTWSVVRILDDAGGSSPTPSISNLPLPNAPPTENYGMDVTYWNESSGLVTGTARQLFGSTAGYVPEERIEIGLPNGQPIKLDQVLAKRVPKRS